MEEVQYYKNVYSKIWVDRTKSYGYDKYVQNLVRLISQSMPNRVFEVGIGTGWPIGVELKRKGIEVDGCDVADNSVVLAQKELGNKNGIWVGDVFEYKGELLYDVTYCVRTSWCISNFYSVIKKMISMTRPGGYIIFDVMDKNSLYCLKQRKAIIKEKYCRLLGIDVDKQYFTHFISISKMKKFLRKNGLSYQYWGEREITNSSDKYNTPKVAFLCRRNK